MKQAKYEDFDKLLTKHGYPTIDPAAIVESAFLNVLGALHDEVMSWKPEFENNAKYRVGEGNGRQDISSDT